MDDAQLRTSLYLLAIVAAVVGGYLMGRGETG